MCGETKLPVVASLRPSHLAGRRSPTRRPAIRLLLACTGWPSGVHEIGSWARRQGLAEVVIFQVQPGQAATLPADDRDWLAPGPIEREIVESLAGRGCHVARDARVVRRASHRWEIVDAAQGRTYRLLDRGDRLDVLVPDNFERPEHLEAVNRYLRQNGQANAVSVPTPEPRTPNLERLLLRVGGAFLLKLIEFRPHVVGFRVEGDVVDEIRGYIEAVRLFSQAEVILGGPTATSHPLDVLTRCGADYLFAGEAEEPLADFLRLAARHDGRDRLAEVPGLTYTYGGRPYHNTLPRDGYGRSVVEAGDVCGPGVRCLRNLVRPVADRDVVVGNRLDWSLLEGFGRPMESLFFTGGRGCPGDCTFCAKLHGQDVRSKTAQQVLEEIQGADALVAQGRLTIGRWDLFKYTEAAELKHRAVSWAAIYDEDFFLNRRRAVEFFRLWNDSPLKERYRLSVQTNPCSMLLPGRRVHEELVQWIDRLKPMIHLGAESFHDDVLTRWQKRHNVAELQTVLDALDRTRQDYTVFQLLTDFETTPEELIETLRLLILNAFRRRRMRIASTAYTIPLYDTEIRQVLDYRGHAAVRSVQDFGDYQRPQPGWMDPLVADLADRADSQLHFSLMPEQREGALIEAMAAVQERIAEEIERAAHDSPATAAHRLQRLAAQAHAAMNEIRDARFQAV